MELSRPLATITPTLDADVLTVLAQHEATFTTGQLHRMLHDASEEGIRKVLRRLARQGIVHSERVGHAFAYRLNRDHLAAGPIAELAQLQATLLTRLEKRLARWSPRPEYAAVFGSAARGAMTAESDLDLFLVVADGASRERWDEQVGALAADTTRWTGNDTRPLQYTVSELASSRADTVLHDVLAHGLTVAGSRAWFTRQIRRGER